MKKYLLIFLIFITQMVFAQQDCITAIPICSDSEISLKPNGTGTVAEGSGCLSKESNSIWLTFSIQTAGTLTFLLTPTGPTAPTIDYDFALYGPNHSCANITETPLRCSYAGLFSSITPPLTGLNMTSTDTTEDGGGDGFVKYIDVLPGQVYHLLLNNYSDEVSPFKLTFGGTATLLTPFDHNTAQIYQPNPFIQPGPTQNGEIPICGNPVNFDFSTLSNLIRNNNPNFVIKYYHSAVDAMNDYDPITTPISVNTTTSYKYAITYVDPNSPISFLNQCREFGDIKFLDKSFTLNPATLTSCSNNNSGTAMYDLTTATVGADPTHVLKYYPSMYDLNNGINEITNPYQYVSAEGSAFVKATNQYGCFATAEITLKFYALVPVNDAALRACFLETNPSTGLFNLNNAAVTNQAGTTTKRFFPSLLDAVDGTNEILNASNYIAPNGVVYVRVSDNRGCYSVAKITLTVMPPVKSEVLKDKIICIEDKTTLDAGPGFKSYEWSTGATTQSITNVGVGTYWVKLKTGECITTQTVKIYPSEQPVVTSIDISNNTLTVNVIGGTPDYQYSMDNINWQTSNVFGNLARGSYKLYVKDSYDCDPIEISVLVPNLINLITPNGDGVNDVIDYSAIADKQNLVLTIFDRYGAKIHQADKSNGYKWDGTIAGKKIPTGTYWYSLTWNENDKKNTPFKFSGWVIVKNRE
ncbi:chromophore lyase [Chryseobacterium lactis]|uniref:Chromophore lyase n=1 Tax=Chryseobacterium lactis TaxID=1241981 RepID=A0A3G6RYM2_CHRLC|nr:T9SS type B sorting domain-containing protein [Chryseobacterium lactis]AZA81682.1 gliding motility-associated C-terminal domain-containing protein [Chryseobacterium lactis]AZB06680.1 gliding motility-associated C-terminal domain-containing protein [Chryseobacterium lactis]PNW15531.1 chromophore lyase [Chryseobacterium lactis]